jgi:transposase
MLFLMAHRGPSAAEICLSDEDREVLALWSRGSSRRAARARIVLACAEPGAANARVASDLGVPRPAVAQWRARFAEAGLTGLEDEPRPGRPKAGLELTGEERAQLEQWARRAKSAQVLALRARIVLACAGGQDNKKVAAQLRTTQHTVARWRGRFTEQCLDGLTDEPRPGRPPSILLDKVEEVLVRTLEEKPDGAVTHWSRASMASKSGLSRSSIGRIWRKFDLKPHLSDGFKISSDPLFAVKVADVVGLCHNPPEKAVVLCVDEKSQIQALDRSQPVLPMMPGMPERRTRDYARHGITSLFAAFSIADGTVISQLQRRHRHQEFLKFLKTIGKNVPAAWGVHLVCDNYGTHKTPEIQEWRSRVVHTPADASASINSRYSSSMFCSSCSSFNLAAASSAAVAAAANAFAVSLPTIFQ